MFDKMPLRDDVFWNTIILEFHARLNLPLLLWLFNLRFLLSKLTGSRAHEWYTGPQIKRIFEMQPEVYNNTERISLVSSFMASLLIGGFACIDHTDGVGINLMDIKNRAWSKKAMEATAPGLEEKLGKLAPAHAVAGLIAPYFVERFQFNKECLVVQWSRDNPNSLAVMCAMVRGHRGDCGGGGDPPPRGSGRLPTLMCETFINKNKSGNVIKIWLHGSQVLFLMPILRTCHHL